MPSSFSHHHEAPPATGGGGVEINDDTATTTTTFSGQKIEDELALKLNLADMPPVQDADDVVRRLEDEFSGDIHE